MRVDSALLRWGLGFTVLVALTSGCAQDPELKKQRHIERGEAYLAEGKYNEAIIELRNALQIDPKSPPALYALARSYRAKGWHYDAARELDRAVELTPDDRAMRVEYARVLLELEAWDDAGTQAALLRSREPHDPEVLYLVAASLLGQGNTKEALALLTDAMKAPGPPRPELHKAFGDAYVRSDRLADAEQAYQRAVEADPKQLDALLALADIARRRNRLDEMSPLIERARAVDPNSARVLGASAAYHVASDNIDAAIRDLERIPARGRPARMLVALGELYIRSGRAADAVRLLAPIAQSQPGFLAARYILGHAYLASRRPAEAVDEFQEVVKRVPDLPLARFSLGLGLVEAGRGREALKEFATVAKNMNEVPEFHFQLARAQASVGRFDQATQAATRFLKLAPDNPRGYFLLGSIEAQRGNLKKATELYARSTALDTSFTSGYIELGHLYTLDQQPEEALSAFDAALKANPKSVAATRLKVAHLVRQKRMPEAIALAQAAIASNPNQAPLVAMLGNLHLVANEPRKAEAEFRKAISMDERSADAHLGLARVALADGKEPEAIGHLQRILRDHPSHLRGALFLALLHTRAARYAQATSVLEPFTQGDVERLDLVLLVADIQLKGSRYDDVIARMRAILARDPSSIPARTLLALALIGKAHVDEAIAQLERVKTADPKIASTHHYLGRARMLRGDTEGAKQALEDALRLDPGLTTARLELAALTGDQRDEKVLSDQLERLKAGIAQDSRNVALRNALASAYMLRGMRAEAEVEYQRILELAPTFPPANLGLAALRLQDKKPDEAAPYLESVVKTRPNDVRANLLLADYYEQKGKREQAAERLAVVHRINPNLPTVKLRLATHYGATGRADAGIKLAQEVVAATPKAAAAHAVLGELLMTRDRTQEAIGALTTALRLDPKLAAAQFMLATAHQRAGNHDQAIAEYRKAQRFSPDNPVIANNIAYLYAVQGRQLDDALTLAKHAHARLPDHPSVLDTMGYVHFRRGEYALAEPLLRRSTELSGASAAAHYHLGMTYYRLGRRDEATASLRRALLMDAKLPQREEIHRVLQEIAKAD